MESPGFGLKIPLPQITLESSGANTVTPNSSAYFIPVVATDVRKWRAISSIR
ncbi:MAG: hypothetical protein WB679_24805 [Terracidiphilus sp.]